MSYSDIASFLATTVVFSGVPEAELAAVAAIFRTASFPAGTLLLKQGGYSDAIYFLREGRLALRMQRGAERETLAVVQPPDAFGEISFLTGKPSVADIEAIVDSDVVFVPREEIPDSGPVRDSVMRGLLSELASKLEVTMERAPLAAEPPIVLMRNGPNWEAPRAFAGELAESLARQTRLRTLVMNIGAPQPKALAETSEKAASIDIGDVTGSGSEMRAVVARHLSECQRFHNILLNVVGPDSAAVAEQLQVLANFRGYLLGPGDPLPEISPEHKTPDFIVQSAAQPALPFLSGSRQLIREGSTSEAAFAAGQPVTPAFRRTVDSIARRIAGLQVGIALGGGAAWGWAHIGVLETLEKAGLPIDVIAGCSMGSVIGSLYCSGFSTADLTEIAAYWRNRTRRLLEWRFWRMCLINERALRKVLLGYFADRTMNQTEIPFWANAVDIETDAECMIRDGLIVDCLRSSIALPGLLPPYSRPPRLLVDSGIMNPVPAGLVREMGCHYAVAVNAMAAPGTTEMSTAYPFNAFHVMMKCMFVMGHEIGQRAEQAADIVFTPDLAGINLLQFGRSAEIIERGRRSTEQRIPAILAGYQRLRETVTQ